MSFVTGCLTDELFCTFIATGMTVSFCGVAFLVPLSQMNGTCLLFSESNL